MGYALTFIGGAMFGGFIGMIVLCCIIGGKESEGEEESYAGEQNQSDGL